MVIILQHLGTRPQVEPVPELTPDPNLILQSPPPLDPTWLAHEEAANLLSKPVVTDPRARQKAYSQECSDRNSHLLSGRDEHLNHGIKIHDTFIELDPVRSYMGEREPPTSGRRIPIRAYNPSSMPSGPPFNHVPAREPEPEGQDIVIYYHGGGLAVGDLDSEDLTCRRICKGLGCTVYSCDYRLMPDHKADKACDDALQAYMGIVRLRKVRRLVLVGSSSGGQLAAMVAGEYGRKNGALLAGPPQPASKTPHMLRPARPRKNMIHGVLLRAPITCDATEGGINIPPRFRPFHTSMRPEFETSILSKPVLDASNRIRGPLPLEDEYFNMMPRHWIQVSTNDIYYSDGILYAQALKQAGVEVEVDIVHGFPHTFWLKAPELERAVEAENDMIEGLRWLLNSEGDEDGQRDEEEDSAGTEIGRNFVQFTDEEFERKFLDI
jgi:acetyl esterase/lipase